MLELEAEAKGLGVGLRWRVLPVLRRDEVIHGERRKRVRVKAASAEMPRTTHRRRPKMEVGLEK
uniref:Uncharacterized protein n=1 Tax=Kalanchoe fedtschenkoi TaxID=63787 RepID=A0A7N0TDG8_KALFE